MEFRIFLVDLYIELIVWMRTRPVYPVKYRR